MNAVDPAAFADDVHPLVERKRERPAHPFDALVDAAVERLVAREAAAAAFLVVKARIAPEL